MDDKSDSGIKVNLTNTHNSTVHIETKKELIDEAGVIMSDNESENIVWEERDFKIRVYYHECKLAFIGFVCFFISSMTGSSNNIPLRLKSVCIFSILIDFLVSLFSLVLFSKGKQLKKIIFSLDTLLFLILLMFRIFVFYKIFKDSEAMLIYSYPFFLLISYFLESSMYFFYSSVSYQEILITCFFSFLLNVFVLNNINSRSLDLKPRLGSYIILSCFNGIVCIFSAKKKFTKTNEIIMATFVFFIVLLSLYTSYKCIDYSYEIRETLIRV